jgi:CRISPR-associated endonuclease Csn1
VEADKGTNLFFAIYTNDKGKRNYETIPLNIVVERQKQGLSSVPETNEVGDMLLIYLSPYDLVYVPSDGDQEINFNKLTSEQVDNIYKMVSASGVKCFFVKHHVASSIVNKMEFSPLNKMEKTITGTMIKDCCIKLRVDRTGNIKRS